MATPANTTDFGAFEKSIVRYCYWSSLEWLDGTTVIRGKGGRREMGRVASLYKCVFLYRIPPHTHSFGIKRYFPAPCAYFEVWQHSSGKKVPKALFALILHRNVRGFFHRGKFGESDAFLRRLSHAPRDFFIIGGFFPLAPSVFGPLSLKNYGISMGFHCNIRCSGRESFNHGCARHRRAIPNNTPGLRTHSLAAASLLAGIELPTYDLILQSGATFELCAWCCPVPNCSDCFFCNSATISADYVMLM